MPLPPPACDRCPSRATHRLPPLAEGFPIRRFCPHHAPTGAQPIPHRNL